MSDWPRDEGELAGPFDGEAEGREYELLEHELELALLRPQDPLQLRDAGLEFGEAVLELIALERGQAGQAHVQDGVGLHLA